MITFYLVRHGSTLFNQLKRMQGWCDSPLIESGIKQATALGYGLQNIEFKAAYSSTSERAIDTLQYIINDRNINTFYSKQLKEYYFGKMEGELSSNVARSKRIDYFYHGWEEEDGESLNTLQTRLFACLQDIYDTYKDGNILIVSHCSAIMAIVEKIDPVCIRTMLESGNRLDNASVTTITYDGNEYKIGKVNDVSYLEAGNKYVEV